MAPYMLGLSSSSSSSGMRLSLRGHSWRRAAHCGAHGAPLAPRGGRRRVAASSSSSSGKSSSGDDATDVPSGVGSSKDEPGRNYVGDSSSDRPMFTDFDAPASPNQEASPSANTQSAKSEVQRREFFDDDDDSMYDDDDDEYVRARRARRDEDGMLRMEFGEDDDEETGGVATLARAEPPVNPSQLTPADFNTATLSALVEKRTTAYLDNVDRTEYFGWYTGGVRGRHNRAMSSAGRQNWDKELHGTGFEFLFRIEDGGIVDDMTAHINPSSVLVVDVESESQLAHGDVDIRAGDMGGRTARDVGESRAYQAVEVATDYGGNLVKDIEGYTLTHKVFLLPVKEVEDDMQRRLRTFDWEAGILELDESGFVAGPWSVEGAGPDAHPSSVLRIIPDDSGEVEGRSWRFLLQRPRDMPSFDAVASDEPEPSSRDDSHDTSEVPSDLEDLITERAEALKELSDEFDVPEVDML